MPAFTGFSHVCFTVADMERSRWFWTEVMGCRVAMTESGFCLCIDPTTGLLIGLKDHDGTVTGSFDEKTVGLDHLSFSAADLAELEAWPGWLSQHDVPHSDITETALGYHLNLRAPDNIPVELFLVKEDAAAALGLGQK